jgi:hypothetical protein
MVGHGLTRRSFALGVSVLPLLAHGSWAQTTLRRMVVTKDPYCGCCGGWITYMRNAGYIVQVVDTKDVARVKARLGVPNELVSCHTTEIAGYVLEGHVPEPAIRRLLAEKPPATGIAVPGMPASAPGMDVPGANDAYDVMLFSPHVRKRFARFQGLKEIAG